MMWHHQLWYDNMKAIALARQYSRNVWYLYIHLTLDEHHYRNINMILIIVMCLRAMTIRLIAAGVRRQAHL